MFVFKLQLYTLETKKKEKKMFTQPFADTLFETIRLPFHFITDFSLKYVELQKRQTMGKLIYLFE